MGIRYPYRYTVDGTLSTELVEHTAELLFESRGAEEPHRPELTCMHQRELAQRMPILGRLRQGHGLMVRARVWVQVQA